MESEVKGGQWEEWDLKTISQKFQEDNIYTDNISLKHVRKEPEGDHTGILE